MSTLEERLLKEPEWMHRPVFSFLAKHMAAIILLGSIFLIYGYFLSHKIDLVTADLGRHIKNGEVMLNDSSMLETNFYSYTNPDFPVINHHWGSGLLLYLAWKFTGFAGVQFFFILLSFATLAVFLAAGRLYAKWDVVGLVTLFALPLLAERTEIRPEVFSYLFAGIFFLILCKCREGCHPREDGDPETTEIAKKLDSRLRGNPSERRFIRADDRKSWKLLWLLPLIEIFWVNTHIYFILGPLILGAFLLEALLVRRKDFGKLLSVFIAVAAATLINPFGYRALTEAVTIFRSYGYRLAENQPVWFMEKLISDPNFAVFKVLFVVLVISLGATLWRNRTHFKLAHVFIIAGISIMAWFAIRNLTLFGLFAVPIIAMNFEQVIRSVTPRKGFVPAVAVLGALFLFASLVFVLPRQFPYWRTFGWGLESGNSKGADFIREQGIHGPLFNNYDIGGYLIFHLFPDEKVFVDNRPEAYPVSFFEDEYIPMQENPEKWNAELQKYRFNAIVFAWHDATPWGQTFLTARIQDPEWAPVYVDERVLIFLKRTAQNEDRIRQFEIPKEQFNVR